MTFDAFDAALWPFLFILLAGTLATDIWRWLGVAVGAGLREDGEVLMWVRAVSTALVAAVIARLVFYPGGELAAVPWVVRLIAFAAGCAGYFVFRRRIIAAVLVGEGALLAGILLAV